jgi:cytochrome c oxidase assembly protein subunit 11
MAAPASPARNPALRRTAFFCAAFAALMVGAAFAAVPLYDLFCRVTGFDGTPMVGRAPSGRVLDRPIAVRFDANVAPGIDWRFGPETAQVSVKPGETTTVFYKVRNAGSAPSVGVATFNVQPALAGAYFVKIQCFCFEEQRLEPGASTDFPVVFYIDPAIADDPNVKDLHAITLSYTYFPARGGRPATTAAARPGD